MSMAALTDNPYFRVTAGYAATLAGKPVVRPAIASAKSCPCAMAAKGLRLATLGLRSICFSAGWNLASPAARPNCACTQKPAPQGPGVAHYLVSG